MAENNAGNEFELAYSEIQRETGAASVTLKRAIQALADDGLIEVKPGRNSRYARFRYLDSTQANTQSQSVEDSNVDIEEPSGEENLPVSGAIESLLADVQVVNHLVENLRRRVRNQEMTIALLQDRLAELEDIIHKR